MKKQSVHDPMAGLPAGPFIFPEETSADTSVHNWVIKALLGF
jgi:hypothetical protein